MILSSMARRDRNHHQVETIEFILVVFIVVWITVLVLVSINFHGIRENDMFETIRHPRSHSLDAMDMNVLIKNVTGIDGLEGNDSSKIQSQGIQQNDTFETIRHPKSHSLDAMDINVLIKNVTGIDGIVLNDSSAIPSMEEIYRLYGSKPMMHGLETCQTYRSKVSKNRRLLAPAGAFNTGTNLLSSLLHRNCQILADDRVDPPKTRVSGIRFQAPWGKHSPPSYRNKNVAKEGGDGVVQDDVLPVVMIKDPMTWMASMCDHRYQMKIAGQCPHLAKNKNEPIGVTVTYSKGIVRHATLLDFWNDWYRDWMQISSYPRIVIRYEDLVFHAEEVIGKVCECAGGEMRDGPFRHRDDSAKGEGGSHKGGSGFLKAVIKYGNETFRDGVLSNTIDRSYFREHVDELLMTTFGYASLHEDRV